MSKTALVTGASNGIGLELCKLLAQDGYNLVLAARSKEKLDSIAEELVKKHGIKTDVIAVDLSQPGSALELFEATQKLELTIDMLVNNAGVGSNGKFVDMDLNSELALLQLNVTSLIELCHYFGKGMSARKQGDILNIASVASFQAGPFMASYYSSKSYVLHFSEALHEELKGSGVNVTVLCPGATETEFYSASGLNINPEKLVKTPIMMTAAQVAKIGFNGLKKGKAIVVSGVLNQIMTQSVRITPRFVVRQIVGMLNRKI
jgi:uncharacterized protein